MATQTEANDTDVTTRVEEPDDTQLCDAIAVAECGEYQTRQQVTRADETTVYVNTLYCRGDETRRRLPEVAFETDAGTDVETFAEQAADAAPELAIELAQAAFEGDHSA